MPHRAGDRLGRASSLISSTVLMPSSVPSSRAPLQNGQCRKVPPANFPNPFTLSAWLLLRGRQKNHEECSSDGQSYGEEVPLRWAVEGAGFPSDTEGAANTRQRRSKTLGTGHDPERDGREVSRFLCQREGKRSRDTSRQCHSRRVGNIYINSLLYNHDKQNPFTQKI